MVSGNRVELKPTVKDVEFEFSKISLKVNDHTHIQGYSAKRVLVSLDTLEAVFVGASIVTKGERTFCVQSSLISGPVQTLTVINLGSTPLCLEKVFSLIKGFKLVIPDRVKVVQEISNCHR